ncbi:MAG: Trk system potassium transporter TrkA [Bacteroidetes bacterium]|jgi:trk system potassium uptake protein|nr:Trk system potassium transporter TrkA [Bacteroidota bacterium]MBT3933202.1 Trk system potassium transporter TrkA [Bacteroidota bacterium]MBT4728954.1 Trk system potassium transporter TrkA [Bacteroidota bacterium]MBT5992311.1 Trk system potassium transporter TrkA [Bacteroidota bacterium]MBT6837976.1 Trk system potassium transporter TrkA [Bacteroidota bacterium]
MNVVIAGAGAVGIYLAKMLVDNDHNVTIIDKDKERLRIAESHIDLMTVKGSSSLISILDQAEVNKADLLIAVTSDYDVNFLTCILGKKLGAKTTIARIDDAEYLIPSEQEVYRNIGVDTMIYPERIAALEIVALLKQTGATETFDFSQGKLSLLQLRIDENALVLHKTLHEIIEQEKSLDFRAVAIKRGAQTIMPTGTDVFLPGDQVYVITKKEKIHRLMEISGVKPFSISNIMIVGGTKIGKRTAIELEDRFNIKLIDKTMEVCEELASELKNTLVINADGTDIEMLKDEGLSRMDAFIAVTDNTELNIFSCLLAKRNGVKRTIALIEDIEFIELSQNIGVDTIINKKLIAASYIHQFTLDAEITSSKCLNGVEADVFELIAKPNSRITKKKIKNLHFPKGVIIGGLVRENESFIVTGDTQVEVDDHVVVFALPALINQIERFFH